jgi:alpha,alpha-trehalase
MPKKFYNICHRTLAAAIDAVLWNEEAKMWFDFDILNKKQRIYFYPSNLFPLWAECYDVTRKEEVNHEALLHTLVRRSILLCTAL